MSVKFFVQALLGCSKHWFVLMNYVKKNYLLGCRCRIHRFVKKFRITLSTVRNALVSSAKLIAPNDIKQERQKFRNDKFGKGIPELTS